MNRFDVVIVGGGAAGLSAALVLGRARRTVLVVDSGAPRNGPAAHIQGFLSRDGLGPADLLAAGWAEVAGYGGRVVTDTISTAAADAGTGFAVDLAAGGRALVQAARRHHLLHTAPPALAEAARPQPRSGTRRQAGASACSPPSQPVSARSRHDSLTETGA